MTHFLEQELVTCHISFKLFCLVLVILYSLSCPQLSNFPPCWSPAKMHTSLSHPLQRTPHAGAISIPSSGLCPCTQNTPQFAPPITSTPPFKLGGVRFSFSYETLPDHSDHQLFLIPSTPTHHHKFLVVYCHGLLCKGVVWIGIASATRFSQR